MLNHEFERVEMGIRPYIEDYNYKLTLATFEVLSEQKDAASKSGINYNDFKLHLLDNYSRLSKESVLNDIINNVRVEDDIDKEKKPADTDKSKKEDKDKSKENEGRK